MSRAGPEAPLYEGLRAFRLGLAADNMISGGPDHERIYFHRGRLRDVTRHHLLGRDVCPALLTQELLSVAVSGATLKPPIGKRHYFSGMFSCPSVCCFNLVMC